MRIATIVLAAAFLFPTFAASQSEPATGSFLCSQKKSRATYTPDLAAGPSSPRHSFDVLNYTLNLDIYNCFLSPFPRSYRATELVTFRVDSALAAIVLDAVNTSLTIDSVGLAGVSFLHASNRLTITLDRQYLPGETAQVRIVYRHNDVTDNAFYASSGMVFTDCEPEGARKWYPCWDRASDKATIDLTARVPRTARFGSNGRLADSTIIGDTTWYHWVSRDPVSTYLVVMTGKVNYGLDVVYWHSVENPGDSIPFRFYYNVGESGVDNIKTRVLLMTTYFSSLFGEHPFEKNGFATLNNQFPWGGMENQTLTSLCPNCWSENLISHEFAHQWFGDMITCGTWADIWLNEGFATYCEALWYEATGGYPSYKNSILGDASTYLASNPHWPIYNPSWAITTPPNGQLFNTAITYAKGSCVLHMLRYTLGDSMFFAALRAYATDTVDFKFQTAVTADLAAKISQIAGQDLGWFFNQWLDYPDHPTYQNTYNINNIGNGQWMVGFRARQTQTSAPFFAMPVEVRFQFATGPDTVIRVMNTQNNQVFEFRFGRQPTAVQFDPDNNIVLKQGTTTVGATLDAPVLVSPSPGALDQSRSPVLTWMRPPSAVWARVQLAADSLFGTPVINDSTYADSLSVAGPLAAETRYYWRVNTTNAGGTGSWSPVWNFTTSSSTSVPGNEPVPEVFSLAQNFPNPFNPSTTISFTLPARRMVELTVFNLLGQEVARLVNRQIDAGRHAVVWDASGFPSGVYLYRLRAGEFSFTRKLILMR